MKVTIKISHTDCMQLQSILPNPLSLIEQKDTSYLHFINYLQFYKDLSKAIDKTKLKLHNKRLSCKFDVNGVNAAYKRIDVMNPYYDVFELVFLKSQEKQLTKFITSIYKENFFNQINQLQ